MRNVVATVVALSLGLLVQAPRADAGPARVSKLECIPQTMFGVALRDALRKNPDLKRCGEKTDYDETLNAIKEQTRQRLQPKFDAMRAAEEKRGPDPTPYNKLAADHPTIAHLLPPADIWRDRSQRARKFFEAISDRRRKAYFRDLSTGRCGAISIHDRPEDINITPKEREEIFSRFGWSYRFLAPDVANLPGGYIDQPAVSTGSVQGLAGITYFVFSAGANFDRVDPEDIRYRRAIFTSIEPKSGDVQVMTAVTTRDWCVRGTVWGQNTLLGYRKELECHEEMPGGTPIFSISTSPCRYVQRG